MDTFSSARLFLASDFMSNHSLFISVRVQIISNFVGSLYTHYCLAKFVTFLSADIKQQGLKLQGVKFFFLLILWMNFATNEAEQAALCSNLGRSFMLMMKSLQHTRPHEQVTFIRLRQAIYDNFVQ